MKTKTLRKMSVVAIAGLMVFGMSGCSKNEDENINGVSETIITNDLSKDLGESFDEEDTKEISKIFNEINDDAFNLLKNKKISELTNEDFKQFSNKYFLWDNDDYLTKKYISLIYNIVDGYDGDFSNNLTKWNSVTMQNRIQYEGYMPIDAIKQMRQDKDYSSIKVKKGDELKDTDGLINFVGYKKWYFGSGCIQEQWWNDTKDYMLENYPDMQYARTFTVTLKFNFDKNYPENDIEFLEDGSTNISSDDELQKVMNYPSNILDLLLVDTNNGWKLIDCKWLYSTRNVIHED